MKEYEPSLQQIAEDLQKLNFEEKSLYLSKQSPNFTSFFPNQTFGQYLFSKVTSANDKFHTNTTNKPVLEFLKEHEAARDNLLKLIVGEDYFPHYMRHLEELREKRCQEIMDNTQHLYHFSHIPPIEIGDFIAPHLQKIGNAISEQINKPLCYASSEKESQYVIKPSSISQKKGEKVSIFMDEKAALISGCQPTEFLDKQALSYRYEVDKDTFKPNVALDGTFTNEYESAAKAKILQVEGPFSIIDMTSPRNQGGWDIPVYFIPNIKDKRMIYDKINELRGIGITRKSAMKQVSQQYPDQLIFFNEDDELVSYAKNLESEKAKLEERQKVEELQQLKHFNTQERQRKIAIEVANKEVIARNFQNPKNRKAVHRWLRKKGRKEGGEKPITEKELKIIKLKAMGSKMR